MNKAHSIQLIPTKAQKVLLHKSFGIARHSFNWEVSRQLAYKAAWNGVELVKADRFFASSKTCCNCGNKKEKLKLSERVYKCENCGIEIDLNAAKNLANFSPTQKSCGSEACGDGSEPLVQRTSVKQELLFNKIKF